MRGQTSQTEVGCHAIPLSGDKERRVRNMALLWGTFGLIVGMVSARGGDLIGILSGALAGVLVLPWLGVALGLIGGHPKATLLGSIWGLVVGALAGVLLGEADLLGRATFCLILGALVGATYSVPFRLIGAVMASLLQSRANSSTT
jgi:hypothetical protein